MKVHRCPHCSKPFLESEARTGKCPVCQEAVWEVPNRESGPAPEGGAKEATKAQSVGSLPPGPAPEPASSQTSSVGATGQSENKPDSPLAEDWTAAPSGDPLPARSRSLTLPILLLVVLGGGILGWIQVHKLQAERDDLARRLSEAEGAIAGAEQRAREAETIRQSTETSATQALTRALNKTELADRMRAALALAQIDPHHKDSQSMLVTGMQNDPAWITPVSKLEPPPQWAVPTLIGLLRDSNPVTRRLSAEALGRLRPGGPIAQAVLDTATRDPDARVRKAAELALKTIQNMNRPPSPTPN